MQIIYKGDNMKERRIYLLIEFSSDKEWECIDDELYKFFHNVDTSNVRYITELNKKEVDKLKEII